MNTGFRTVIIEKHNTLEYYCGSMKVTGDEACEIPLYQIRTLIINSLQVRLTAYLLNELIKSEIKVIFCGEKKNPAGEIVGFDNNTRHFERLKLQLSWTEEEKNLMWQRIVSAKLTVESKLLKRHSKSATDIIDSYKSEIAAGDSSNREGLAARVYFPALFGKGFTRSSIDGRNSALNYGYTIMLSEFNRTITEYGYETVLGINHRSERNPFNLNSDLMEPFRSFIDEKVYLWGDSELDKVYKKELIGVMYEEIRYDGKKMQLSDAIRLYAYELLENMSNPDFEIKEISFKK